MDWLNQDDAIPQFRALNCVPQEISFATDVKAMRNEIPISPQIIKPMDGLNSTVYRWYGRIGNRLLTIEHALEVDETATEHVTVTTPYAAASAGSPDWSVIVELKPLPPSILLCRPLFIGSQDASPKYAVYRPDRRGWEAPIYFCSDSSDATDLLSYLKSDSFNESCFVAPVEPPSEWGILRATDGTEQIVGVYPSRHDALRVAWKYSLQNALSSFLHIKDLSGNHPGVLYHFTDQLVAVKSVTKDQ